MKQDINVYEVEERWTKKTPPSKFWSLKTDIGKVSVFDVTIGQAIVAGKIHSVDIIDSNGYKNIGILYEVKGDAPAQSAKSEGNFDSRMRRITDCVLKSEEAFIQDRIAKEDVAEHARALYNLVEEIANANQLPDS